MRTFSLEAKVGVVVLAALAAVTWLSFQIGEFRFREKGYVIEAVFGTVSGLEPKAKVQMAGVLIGSVDRIFLKEGRAHVHLRIDDGVIVREDSVITIGSIGILSERFVEITAGSPSARALTPGEVVAGQETIDMDKLMAQMAKAIDKVGALTEGVSKTIGGEDSTVARLLRNIDSLVDRVNALIDDNRRSVDTLLAQSAGVARDTRELLGESREGLLGTVTNLRDFSATLNRRADQLAAELEKTAADAREVLRGGNDEVRALMSSLRAAAAKSEAAADSLHSILKKVDSGTGTLGRLVNDSRSLDKVDRAVDQFGGVAERINAGQGTLGKLVTDDRLIGKVETAVDSANKLLGESDRMHLFLGYRGEYLAERGDVKNYVTVKLQPREDKYYRLEFVDDPAGRRTITDVSSSFSQPGGDYHIDERTIRRDEGKLKFSVEFVKQFGPLTLHGGLVESQGGAGLEWRLFSDRAEVGVEGWDFSREEGPHFKLTGRVRVLRDFFVNAGVDDFSEPDLRSVFVGGGILFSDEDLKYLLSLARFGK